MAVESLRDGSSPGETDGICTRLGVEQLKRPLLLLEPSQRRTLPSESESKDSFAAAAKKKKGGAGEQCLTAGTRTGRCTAQPNATTWIQLIGLKL